METLSETSRKMAERSARNARQKCAQWIAAFAMLMASGCGNSNSPTLVPVDGVITYQGEPLANARITFVPEKGPMALGVSDKEGKFVLSSGGRPGVSVGKCAVAVSVIPQDEQSKVVEKALTSPPKNASEAQNFLNTAGQMQQEQAARAKSKSRTRGAKSKPVIPEKYGKLDKSGLVYTVEKQGKKNMILELN